MPPVAQACTLLGSNGKEAVMTDDPNYLDAKRHVEALKGFYIHGIVFLCVMSGLIGLNSLSSTNWWVQWPLLGWGIGIIGHAILVYAPVRLLGREWEKRKIEERLGKS
jgi:2TM domain